MFQGIKVSPTILLQNIPTADGTIIEDAVVDLEPSYHLSSELKICTINIERNEAITCTTAFLSADTLLPNKDTRKRKRRSLEDWYDGDVEVGSDDGMEPDDEQEQVIEEWWKNGEIEVYSEEEDNLEEYEIDGIRIQEIKSEADVKEETTESDTYTPRYEVKSPPAKKRKLQTAPKSKSVNIASALKDDTAQENLTEDVFGGDSEGKVVAREVNLNELLELNEMMGNTSDGEEENEAANDTIKYSDNLDSSMEVKEESDIDLQKEQLEESNTDLTEKECTVDNEIKQEDDSVELNDGVDKSETREDAENKAELDNAINSVEISQTEPMDSGDNEIKVEEKSVELIDSVDKTDVMKEVKEDVKEEEPESANNNVESSQTKLVDSDEDAEEEVVGSSWLNDYIDEFEEENEKHQTDEDSKGEPGLEENVKLELDEPKEEEMLQDDIFTKDYLEQYLSYMSLIDATGKPTNASHTVACEKCRARFADVDYLYMHLEKKSLCRAMYKRLESATFAKDPPLERKDQKGYMEVFGCYACSYTSYDPAGVRQHWLREHLEDGQYVCR